MMNMIVNASYEKNDLKLRSFLQLSEKHIKKASLSFINHKHLVYFQRIFPHTWVHLIQDGHFLLKCTMRRHLKFWPLEILTGIVEVLFRSKKKSRVRISQSILMLTTREGADPNPEQDCEPCSVFKTITI